MKSAKELKKHALSRLSHCWGENCLIFFISVGGISAFIFAWVLTANFLKASGTIDFSDRVFDLSSGMLMTVTIFAVFVLWAVFTPFEYGVKWFRLQQIRGKSVNAGSIFSCYGSAKRVTQVLKLNGLVMLKRLCILLPICAAVLLEAFTFRGITVSGGEAGIVNVISGVCLLLTVSCMLCLFFILNMRYAAVPFLYALEPDCPPKELIRKSKRILKNNAHSVIEVLLSMAGWLIPALTIFTLVFILPYVQMVYTAAINELIEADTKIEKGDFFAELV